MKSAVEMIETVKLQSSFDIVQYACPDDDTGFMLVDLQDHFNTLHALAKTLTPERIVSFNTGYGYGAAALLHGAPFASFEGYYLAEAPAAAVAWTEQLLAPYPNANLAAEARPLLHSTYDLLEITGAGDGDYLFATLERYACRSRWFVVSMNSQPVNDTLAFSFWLRKYDKLIRHAGFLPTRQGLWLVEMKLATGQTLSPDSLNYKDTEQFYTGEYFLTDCGGYPQFRKSEGKELAEPRLVAIYNLAAPGPGMHILDVGCGRGELAFALAQAGAEVLAIDYAADAAALAQSTYGDLEICRSRKLVFEQQDLFTAEFDGQFDLIIAADFIEHIDASLEETAIEKLHASLKPGGRLIIHTAPNLLNYHYAYKRRRQQAAQAGSYLPPNPRSFYEQIVHINEQTPARLKRLLRRSFLSTVTWVASDAYPAGTLVDKQRHGILLQGLSIFSIASDASVTPQEIRGKLFPQLPEVHETEPVKADLQPPAVKSLLKVAIGRIAAYLTGTFTGGQRNKNR